MLFYCITSTVLVFSPCLCSSPPSFAFQLGKMPTYCCLDYVWKVAFNFTCDCAPKTRITIFHPGQFLHIRLQYEDSVIYLDRCSLITSLNRKLPTCASGPKFYLFSTIYFMHNWLWKYGWHSHADVGAKSNVNSQYMPLYGFWFAEITY